MPHRFYLVKRSKQCTVKPIILSDTDTRGLLKTVISCREPDKNQLVSNWNHLGLHPKRDHRQIFYIKYMGEEDIYKVQTGLKYV